MIGRLNHVAIAVRDIGKAAAIYRDVLGAEVSAAVEQDDSVAGKRRTQVGEIGVKAQIHFVQVVVLPRHADRARGHDVQFLPLDVQRNIYRRNFEGELRIVGAQRGHSEHQQGNERRGDEFRELLRHIRVAQR